MREVYLILTDTGSLISRFFKFFSRKNYNHISIALNKNKGEFYSFARKLRYFPLIGGFVIENKNTGMYKVFKNTRCIVYKMYVDERKYKKLESSIERFEKYNDKYRYNLIGLLGLLVNKPVKRKNHYFCSQFIAELFHECEIYKFTKDVSLTIPADFQSIPGLIVVYEGKLSEYNVQEETDHIQVCSALTV